MLRRPAPRLESAIGSEGLNAVMRLIAAVRAPGVKNLASIGGACRAKLGMEASALCRLENFKVVDPTIWTLSRWAEALDCKLDLDIGAKSTANAAAP